jgi:hypothetical protein
VALCLGALDLASISLRPTDELRLEVYVAYWFG